MLKQGCARRRRSSECSSGMAAVHACMYFKGLGAEAGLRAPQMFKRVFQLTAQQPVDECLALLGDCMVADLDAHAVQPVVCICRTTETDLSVRAGAWLGIRSAARWAVCKKPSCR